MPLNEGPRMKLAFFISSAINLDSTVNQGFSYSNKRTQFNSDERLRQTQFTINSINLVCPDSTIYLFDSSTNAEEYSNKLSYVRNLKFIPLIKLDKDTATITRSHPTKGYCEALGTELFLKNYIEELSEYDFITKVSGRYYYASFDNKFFNQENKNSYLVKQIKNWDWNENWQYPNFLNINGKLFWSATQTYAIGKNQIQNFYNNFSKITNYYRDNEQNSNHIDFECLMYYFVLRNQNLVEIPWSVGGWTSAKGDFIQW